MNYEVKLAILNKIKEYDRIMLFRHVRNDGDCVGATKGMKRILQLTFPEKEIYLIDSDKAQYLEFLGPEDEPVADELYADALGIVIDTVSVSDFASTFAPTLGITAEQLGMRTGMLLNAIFPLAGLLFVYLASRYMKKHKEALSL